MNGKPGIEKGCLLVFVAIGPRTAIVNVLNCSGIQNLEPNRTILFSTAGRLGGVSDHYPTPPSFACFPSLDARAPAPAPSTHCRLAVCAAIWSDSPSVASIGPISELCEIVTFVTTAFGHDRRLNNQRTHVESMHKVI